MYWGGYGGVWILGFELGAILVFLFILGLGSGEGVNILENGLVFVMGCDRGRGRGL